MPLPTPNWLYAIVPASFVCVICWKWSLLGLDDAFKLAGRGVLFVIFYTWTMAYILPLIKSAFSSKAPSAQLDHEETKRRQMLARKEFQEKHSEMASHHQEFVLKPREEQREADQNMKQRHNPTSVASWRLTEGHRLGGGEEEEQYVNQEEEAQTPYQQAIRRRKLPECVLDSTRKPAAAKSVNLPDHRFRQVMLPEEPAEDAEDVVRLALKCPSGKTIFRRFLKSNSSTLLLLWMQKAGYHPTIYTICTSYPRRQLEMIPDLNLEELGLVSHTVLYVEEKDPSTT